MEDIQPSPDWSPMSVHLGSESSSPTAANINTCGPHCLTPTEDSASFSFSPYTDPNYQQQQQQQQQQQHQHLLNIISTLTQTLTNQQSEISNLAATISTQSQRIEEIHDLESTRLKRRARNETLDAYSLRGFLRKEEWEFAGCERRRRRGGGLQSGDAVEDAMMYIRGQRRDRSLWGRLYTLTPERVMECYRTDDEATISVLDKRATLVLSRGEDDRALAAVDGAYRRFIHLLEHAWGEQPEEDMQSPLTRAYLTFWDTCREGGF